MLFVRTHLLEIGVFACIDIMSEMTYTEVEWKEKTNR